MSRKTSAATIRLKERIIEVTNNLADYWPLTLRQAYYQLVAQGDIENCEDQYKKLSKITTDMRNEGSLSWAVFEDRSRRAVEKARWSSKGDFVREQLATFLRGYHRCLVQQQTNYVELWTEKDALSRIFESVGIPYCVYVVTCRGHVSTTYIKEYADRALYAIERGQQPVIVYGGDLDPSGWRIPVSIKERLWRDHSLDVELDRFALNPDQISHYKLPSDPKALKASDPNAAKFMSAYGRMAVELDAMHPADLENEIVAALARHLDVESMIEEQQIQAREQKQIREIRRKIITTVESMGIAI